MFAAYIEGGGQGGYKHQSTKNKIYKHQAPKIKIVKHQSTKNNKANTFYVKPFISSFNSR